MRNNEYFIAAFKEQYESGTDANVRTYSGRMMFGRNCFAIDGDHTACMQFIAETINNQISKIVDDEDGDVDEVHEFVRKVMNFRSDSMGTGMVYYWPDVSFEYSDQDAFYGESDEESSAEE